MNEWLLHDANGENGPSGQLRAVRTIEKLTGGPLVLCVMAPSAWLEKAYSIMRYTDPTVRQISKALWLSVLSDSRKTLWLNPVAVTPSARTAAVVAPLSDRYLIETAVSLGARLIVTTDQPLIAAYSGNPNLTVQHRDSFLSTR